MYVHKIYIPIWNTQCSDLPSYRKKRVRKPYSLFPRVIFFCGVFCVVPSDLTWLVVCFFLHLFCSSTWYYSIYTYVYPYSTAPLATSVVISKIICSFSSWWSVVVYERNTFTYIYYDLHCSVNWTQFFFLLEREKLVGKLCVVSLYYRVEWLCVCGVEESITVLDFRFLGKSLDIT